MQTQTPTDARLLFRRATDTATRTIAGVRASQLDDPTPCDEFDVRLLLGHLVAVVQRVTFLGRGDDPFLVNGEVTGVGDDAWTALWLETVRQAERAWADDEVLTRTMTLPWAELPGAEMLDSYTEELTIHTWDLATATGQHVDWDDEVLAVAWASISAMGEDRQAMFDEVSAQMPAELRPSSPPFRNPVPVDEGAPLIDRIAAWAGRTVG